MLKVANLLKDLRSYLLTLGGVQRSIRVGWSKVVGSGSNLVATPIM
jgi:hypothetical protein